MKPITLSLAMAAALGAAAQAQAMSIDSAPACLPSRVVPLSSPLPANAPAIALLPYRTPPTEIRVEDADGMPVAVQVIAGVPATFIQPSGPLKPGLHTIKFLDACKPEPPLSSSGAVTIMVGAAVPLPTIVGSATSPSLSPVTTCRGANATVNVDLTLSPELRAYRELSVVNVSIDGLWRGGSYQDYWLESAQQNISIPVSCEEGATINRTIVITARVAGTTEEAAPAPLRINVNAPCPPKSEWVPCSHDGGTFFGDAGTLSRDAGADAQRERNPSDGSGCRFGWNRRTSAPLPGVLVVLAFVVWRITTSFVSRVALPSTPAMRQVRITPVLSQQPLKPSCRLGRTMQV